MTLGVTAARKATEKICPMATAVSRLSHVGLLWLFFESRPAKHISHLVDLLKDIKR